METEEVWKDVPPEFFSLEASNTGKVRWKKSKKPVAEYQGNNGYRVCNFKPRIHQLIAAAFLGMPPENMVVNHKDLNKLNNNPENFEYITSLENIKHGARERKKQNIPNKVKTEKPKRYVLSNLMSNEKAQEAIQDFYLTGSVKETADKYGIGQSAMRGLLRRTGVALTGRGLLSPAQQQEVVDLFKTGEWSKGALARKFGVDDHCIRYCVRKFGVETP